MNFEQYLTESIKYKYVVRNGKKIKKAKTTKQGTYRIQYIDGKPTEVRITAKERKNRKLGQKKGKIKRASKEKLIELKRKKSFIARKNVGLKTYNKSLPDKVQNRKPYVPKPKDDKPLAPSFKENFQEYLNDSLLLEWPENLIWYDKEKDTGLSWDWCAEETPEDGEWLKQLVQMYRDHVLETLKMDRNSDYPYLELTDSQIDEITDNLCNDFFFIMQFKYDLLLVSDELKNDINKYVPKRLLDAVENWHK